MESSCLAEPTCDHYIPPPPTQPQSHMLCGINNVCNFKDVITSHPPTHHMLRSINHVCNFKDVIHPTPPNPTCYVASTMCATSKMSLHPTPPPTTCYVASTMCATSKMSLHPTQPQSHMLRSINHVCNIPKYVKCGDSYEPLKDPEPKTCCQFQGLLLVGQRTEKTNP